MKIGIDLDGVVFDSETLFRIYEEIYSIECLENDRIIDREEPKFQGRYNWTEEQMQNFREKYYLKVSNDSTIMPGFKTIYGKLKELGHEFVVITARGESVKQMQDDAIRLLNENNIIFDKYYWQVEDKLEVCKKENIELMIDDDYHIVEKLSNNKIKSLYFRDVGLKKIEENDYLIEVNNWGDIYRYFANKTEV